MWPANPKRLYNTGLYYEVSPHLYTNTKFTAFKLFASGQVKYPNYILLYKCIWEYQDN